MPGPYVYRESADFRCGCSRRWPLEGCATPPAAVQVRGLVFINPGNPTGQCLTKQNLQELIQFCADEHLVLMADEVGLVSHADLMSIITPWLPYKVVSSDSPDCPESCHTQAFTSCLLL